MTDAMPEADGGDEYSDDDLDALPVDTFHELQQNAIQSTQQPKSYEWRPRPGAVLPRMPVPAARLVGVENLTISDNASNDSHTWNNPHQLSSDYGDFDDEMLDGEIFDAADEPGPVAGLKRVILSNPHGEGTQSEGFRQSRFVATSQLRGYETNQYTLRSRPALNMLQTNEGLFNDREEPNLPAREEVHGMDVQPPEESEAVSILQAQVQKVVCSHFCFSFLNLLTVTESYFESVIRSKWLSTRPTN